MSNAPQIAEVAALVGDPARANMLVALLGGHALTATVAYADGVSPQTTSGHLGKLSAARLVVLMKQGRHHYYRLTGPHAICWKASCMSRWTGRRATSRARRPTIRCATPAPATTTSLASSASALPTMTTHDFGVLGDEAGEVTPTGMEFLTRLGVDLAGARAKRRVFCRPCLDWTERGPHISGAVGAAWPSAASS
jgi:DNA-binding transcriptional ArsR family regulator